MQAGQTSALSSIKCPVAWRELSGDRSGATTSETWCGLREVGAPAERGDAPPWGALVRRAGEGDKFRGGRQVQGIAGERGKVGLQDLGAAAIRCVLLQGGTGTTPASA